MEDVSDPKLAAVLARIDERTKNTEQDVREIKSNLEGKFVTKESFSALQEKVALLQRIVFGLIGLIVVAVFGAILRLVINQGL